MFNPQKCRDDYRLNQKPNRQAASSDQFDLAEEVKKIKSDVAGAIDVTKKSLQDTQDILAGLEQMLNRMTALVDKYDAKSAQAIATTNLSSS